jgi:hypothetical protein
MGYRIFAVEDDLTFDRAYCRTMPLPFHFGWDHWEVFETLPNQMLRFRQSFSSYSEAERYLSNAIEH